MTEIQKPPPSATEFAAAGARILALRGSTAEQFQRYVREFVVWCDEHQLPRRFDAYSRAAFRRHLAAVGKLGRPKAWERRASYLNKIALVQAALDRQQRIATSRWRTRLIDGLPPDGTLRQGIDAILLAAPAKSRASLRSEIAVVLAWCEQSDVEPTQLGAAELKRYDMWLALGGRRSRGTAYAARRLSRQFRSPERWWLTHATS